MKATIELELYKAYAAKLEAEIVATSKYGQKPSIHERLHSLWIDAVEEVLGVGERSEE